MSVLRRDGLVPSGTGSPSMGLPEDRPTQADLDLVLRSEEDRLLPCGINPAANEKRPQILDQGFTPLQTSPCGRGDRMMMRSVDVPPEVEER